MQQKYAKIRPGLIYVQMDALQTEFDSSSFNAIFDKGTLDALFPDGSLESRTRVTRLFNVNLTIFNLWYIWKPLSFRNRAVINSNSNTHTQNKIK